MKFINQKAVSVLQCLNIYETLTQSVVNLWKRINFDLVQIKGYTSVASFPICRYECVVNVLREKGCMIQHYYFP
jgi:hypothetical protein